jgi:hypothetical protein
MAASLKSINAHGADPNRSYRYWGASHFHWNQTTLSRGPDRIFPRSFLAANGDRDTEVCVTKT